MESSNPTVGSVTPPFRKHRKSWGLCLELAQRLMAVDASQPSADVEIERVRRDGFAAEVPAEHRTSFAVVVSVFADLRLQGWSFDVRERSVRLLRPVSQLEPDLERRRIQRMHAVNRDAQLLRDSVRRFVRGLEKKRLGPNGWVSVFSLMRDGRELAENLRHLQSLRKERDQLEYLKQTIRPYLQVVTEDATCPHTGLMLSDIWRYFRYTWTNEYQTVPGRNLMLLVRDAVAPNHPVVGIAALASPVVHLGNRDEWIGWAPRQFVNMIRENPTTSWAKWVDESLRDLMSEIYTADLFRDRLLSKKELDSPTEDTIAKLEEEAVSARREHRMYPSKSLHKTPAKELSHSEWQRRAESHLFRSKRCTALAALLRAKYRLKHAGFDEPTRAALASALESSEGRLAVETIRKQVKAIHIGNDVLDISICGAIAPYSELIGGKLVAMLLTGPEIVRYYAQRYGKASSIIASSMAGRRISRRPRLAVLTTTSLYGAEPNQYTRTKIPVSRIAQNSDAVVEFKRLGLTRGQGSYHFSAATVDSIEVLMSQMAYGRSVNSIFGEGVSPRLRKIRSGLDACGFPTDAVLTHGAPRVVYGIALTENPLDVLLGRVKRPRYLADQSDADAASQSITEFWVERWLHRRALRQDIIERVEAHTLVSPVEHGARVALPRILEEEPLFFHQD